MSRRTKRVLPLLLSLSILCIGQGNANLVYAQEQNIQVTLQQKEIRHSNEIPNLEDGEYVYYGKDYYIKDGKILMNESYNNIYYNKFGNPANDTVYEFTDNTLEEKDKAYWEALTKVASLQSPNDEVTPILNGFPNLYELHAYKTRVEYLFNCTETPMIYTYHHFGGDPWMYLAIKNNQESIDKAREIIDSLNQINQAYDDLGFDSIEEPELKIEAIHDWIATNIKYDYTLTKRWAMSGLRDKKMVCSGYAQLFYHFCKRAGIEVETVYGAAESNVNDNDTINENHVWNRVLLNGEYKYLDITWDSNLIEGIDVSNIDNKELLKSVLLDVYYLKDKTEFDKDHIIFYVFK